MSIARIIVRMYRQLLGDCFLLRIQGSDARWTHVLIDCGVLQNLRPPAVADMKEVAADIVRTTGGDLDLLVITHEHWDHIGGFSDAKDPLLDPDKLKIRELWMAWTEDPNDDQASELRARFTARRQALALAAQAFGADDTTRGLIDDLANFIGPVDQPGALGAAPDGRMTGRRIMETLVRQAERVRYLAPGSIVTVSDTAPLPAAVLAPPRDTVRLFKDAPSGGDAKETYLAEASLKNSFLAMDSDGTPQLDRDTPFAWRFSNGLRTNTVADAATADPDSDAHWLWQRYFAAADPEEGREQAYRRIDGTWAEAARGLALKLDSDTNNTSLVLAFRVPDGADGRPDSFLLFAADAQVGNWLSWHDQTYPFADGALSAEQILNRTRLYKVGHHGSHNATLADKGLKMMTDSRLAAMVSTVETVAAEQGRKESGGWKMPDSDVKAALLKQTGGRLLRGDRNWAGDGDCAAAHGDADFRRRLDDTHALYLEYLAFERADAPPTPWQNGDTP